MQGHSKKNFRVIYFEVFQWVHFYVFLGFYNKNTWGFELETTTPKFAYEEI